MNFSFYFPAPNSQRTINDIETDQRNFDGNSSYEDQANSNTKR